MWLSWLSGVSASKLMMRWVGDGLAAVEVLDVVHEATVELEASLHHPVGRAARCLPALAAVLDVVGDGVVVDCVGDLYGGGPLVADDDLEALVQERHLAEPVGDGLEGVFDGLEDVVVGPETGRRTGLVSRLALLQGPGGHTHLEGLEPLVAIALDLDLDALGERVDHRDTDAVQATGDLVATPAELAPGVEHGQHDGDRRQLLARGDVDGDAATVVGDLDRTVGEDRHLDPVTEAGQGLVDRVVHDLPHQVVQAAFTGGADVHSGTLADCFEAFEDLDRAGVVVARLDRVAFEDAGCDHLGRLRVLGQNVGRCVGRHIKGWGFGRGRGGGLVGH